MEANGHAPPVTDRRARVVVVNFNGGDLVMRCFEHLVRTEWPADRLELVLVDNASDDGSADRVAERFPQVRVIRSERNLGFAGGNNLALRDLDGIDLVGLVNPDAFVEPGWLEPLASAAGSGPPVGAANPKILLEPRFAPVEIETEGFSPGAGDPRRLGVRLSGVRLDGEERWGATLFPTGFYDLEADRATHQFRWSEEKAELWLPLAFDSSGPATFRLRLDAEREKPVVVRTGGVEATLTVGTDPTWFEVETAQGAFDVINSAGASLVDEAYAVERGYGERDGPAWDEPVEVFAFTGAAVVLDVEYLRDVGLFDDAFFLYSEELDLSWRGRLRGWHFAYVPESRVRHVRGALVGHRSAVADHYSHRNALLTLVKNAPGPVWRRELRHYLRDLLRLARAEILLPLRRGNRPQPRFTRRRLRVVFGVVRRLPHALVERWRIGRRATVSRADVLEWQP